MTEFDSANGQGTGNSLLPAPLLPPIPAGTSLTINGQKRCCSCQADLTYSKKTLDLQGRFHCPDCWNKRVRAGTAIDLVRSGASQVPAVQQALSQVMGQNALSGPDGRNGAPSSIMVYVNPAPAPAAERGKVAFFFGFYATAGIAAALITLLIGAVVFFAIQSAWQKHEIASLNALRQETPIQQEAALSPVGGAMAPLQPVHLDAGVDGDSTLRVAALNSTTHPLRNVVVEVIADHAAPMALVSLGSMEPGQNKTLFIHVPGLSQAVLAGQTVRLRVDAEAARTQKG